MLRPVSCFISFAVLVSAVDAAICHDSLVATSREILPRTGLVIIWQPCIIGIGLY